MIIGITGTIAAGKGTVVEILQKKGFTHYSARDYLTKELLAQQKPINRDEMRKLADFLRETKGPDIVIRSLFEMAQQKGGDVIIESVRSLGEVTFLEKQSDFHLLGVDADIKTRYERAIRRGTETDKIDFNTFVSQNEKENSGRTPFSGNILGCIQKADILINNDGTIEELEKNVQAVLDKISN